MKVKRMQLGEKPDVELEDTLGPAKGNPSLADAEDVGTFALDEDEEIELTQNASLDQLFTQDDISFLQESREHPGFSFDSIIAPDETVDDIEYKAKNIKVNHLLVIRKPIKVTPSMCRAVGCNYDSATANGFPGGWESIPKARRHIFAELVKQHSARYHSGIESHIIKKSQMPKNWLHKG
jgi:hypothetical protein